MKTQNTKLVLGKSSVLELQEDQLLNINGGSTVAGGPDCTGCVCFEVGKQVDQINANAAF